MNKRLVTVSKFLSKYLRHEPESLGLVLEPGGWVPVEDVLAGASRIGFSITAEELNKVVAENDKQRFAFDETGSKIRANQGHSTEVDLQLKEVKPPERLYHGTVARFVDAILTDGLKKMNRHDVHLSKDVDLTRRGGEGMVVKPIDFVFRGRKGLVQPAVKCRGPEYLRIIYGPDYNAGGNLSRLRARGLAHKRSLTLREFALGIEALERFVRREPLRRVHECVFAVLALESEPVDPRL